MRTSRLALFCLLVAACDDSTTDAPPDGALPGDPDAGDPGDPDAGLADNGETTFTNEVIGDPVFTIVNWRHYSTPMGNDPGASDWIDAVLPTWPGHEFYPDLFVIGPGAAHAGPYDLENADAVVAAGFDDGNVFSMSAWTIPMGLTLTGVIVPTAGAPTGSSPDSPDGPIIPDAIWPIAYDADLLREGVIVDPDFDSTYIRVGEVLPGTTYDGYSHMPLTFGESTIFIPGTPGEYEYVVTVTDAAGNGIRSRIPFTVVP